MRTLHTRKRSRSVFGRYGRPSLFKRRRFMRRRRFRRRSTNTQTSRGLFAQNPFFLKRRKTSSRNYRRALLATTRFHEHFKTIQVTSDPTGTPAGTVLQRIWAKPVLSQISLGEFWHTAGGLQDPGFGVVPSWAGATAANDPLKICIRGGRIWVTVALSGADADACKARVQLMWPKQQQRSVTDGSDSTALGFPGTATGYLGTSGVNLSTSGPFVGADRPVSLSVQELPDWSEYFYDPVIDKSMELRPGDTFSVYWKIKPVVINTDAFKRGQGWYPWVVVYLSQMIDRDALVEASNIQVGYNLSFSVMETLT